MCVLLHTSMCLRQIPSAMEVNVSMRSKIWDIFLDKIKEMKRVEAFKVALKKKAAKLRV